MTIYAQSAEIPDGHGLQKADIRSSRNADAVSDKSKSWRAA